MIFTVLICFMRLWGKRIDGSTQLAINFYVKRSCQHNHATKFVLALGSYGLAPIRYAFPAAAGGPLAQARALSLTGYQYLKMLPS